MSKKVLVNSKTGEIIEAEELCPFRSLTDLKRDELKDGEDYKPGTSCTSMEGYEPLEAIVARCLRTMKSSNGVVYQVLDMDALKAEETQQGVYDASGAKTVDEAFDTMDPTDSQGFDFADASRIQNNLAEGLSKIASSETSSNLSTQGTNATSPNSAVSDDVVGKSESKSESDAFPEKGNSNISTDGK